jgi:ABC-type polysaccharide/polyol phosphate export permease
MNLIASIWARRFALRQLVLRNFRVRYRNMALGVLWSVLNPLVMLAVLAFVFTYVYPRPDKSGNFTLFLLIGLVHFNIFSRMVPSATASVIEQAALIKKVAFPRIITPLSVVLAQLVDVLVLSGLLFLFTIAFHQPLSWHYLWIPLALVVELIFITGIGFIFSALNVYYRDMLYIVESWLTVLFWLTPVFYPLDYIRVNLPSVVYNLYILNPLVGCIEASRRAVLYQSCPDLRSGVFAIVVSLCTLFFGAFVFQRLQRRFTDFT